MENTTEVKLTIEDVIKCSGLSDREFAAEYKIPLGTINMWKKNGGCKEYFLNLLYEKIVSDKSYQSDQLAGEYFAPDFLKVIGYCYEGLQQILGHTKQNHMAAVFPVKYFLLTYLEYGCMPERKDTIPEPLKEKLQYLAAVLSDEKYEGTYDYAVPLGGRKYFEMGRELYLKDWMEEIKKIKMDIPILGKETSMEITKDMTRCEIDALLELYIDEDIKRK